MKATCRFCGAMGDEAVDDPAPGVCPKCLDARMNETTIRFEACARSLGASTALYWVKKDLVETVGLTPVAAEALLTRVIEGG